MIHNALHPSYLVTRPHSISVCLVTDFSNVIEMRSHGR